MAIAAADGSGQPPRRWLFDAPFFINIAKFHLRLSAEVFLNFCQEGFLHISHGHARRGWTCWFGLWMKRRGRGILEDHLVAPPRHSQPSSLAFIHICLSHGIVRRPPSGLLVFPWTLFPDGLQRSRSPCWRTQGFATLFRVV